jgi:hypothetical protein
MRIYKEGNMSRYKENDNRWEEMLKRELELINNKSREVSEAKEKQ